MKKRKLSRVVALTIMTAMLVSVLPPPLLLQTVYASEEGGSGEDPGENTTPGGISLDIAPPNIVSGDLTVSQITDKSLNLSWEAATTDVVTTDGAINLMYQVVYSKDGNISTVEDAEANGTVATDWTANLTSTEVTGLTPNLTYYFNVMVKSVADKKSIYTTVAQPTLIGARAEFGGENGTELFLGGNYIELGISNWGDFGTLGSKPDNFRGTLEGEVNLGGGSTQVGMSADHDGFNNGRDLPVDYYLPGTKEERFAVGYKKGEAIKNNSNSAQMNDKNMITTIENMSDTSKGLLKAKTVSKWADTMEITQVISFSTNDKFYRNEVTLKNISTENWDGARYLRNFDPDNTQFRGGEFTTDNTVTHTVGEDGKAVVKAETYDDNDPLYKAFASRAPIFFYSNDAKAVASIFTALTNKDPYHALAYDNPQTKGATVRRDVGIMMTWDSGPLLPDESKTFVYYTSLDERDFGEVQGEIVIADIEKDIEDMEDMDDVKKIKDKIDNEKDLDEDKKDEFREILIGDVCDYPGVKDIPLRNAEDIIIMGELIKESGKAEDEKDNDREKLVDKVIRDIEDLEDKEKEKDAIQDVIDEIKDEAIKERTQSKIDGIPSEPKYTLTYDANGAEGTVPTSSTKYIEGTQVSVLGKGSLVKPGYNFISWNTQADGKGISYKVSEAFSISQHITLYAQWQKIDKVQIPKITENNVRRTEVVTQDGNATTISVTAEVTDGGTLSYQWYKNAINSTTGGTAIIGATDSTYTPPTDELGTLYYYVVITNTLEIDGKLTHAPNTCGIREEIVIAKASEVVYEISAATGSVLEHMSLSPATVTQYQHYVTTLNVEGGYTRPSSIIVKMGNKTLVAGIDYIYEKETGSLIVYHVTEQPKIEAKGILIPATIYTISFNTNGGTAVETISGVYGKAAVTLPTPTKAGYSFAGWYRDSSFTTSYTLAKMGKENITLYAKWEQTTFIVNGDVVDEAKEEVKAATVKLMAGSRKVAEVKTDANGTFTITGVSSGTYNLVISKGDQTVTQVITVSTEDITIGTITLPKGNKNSIVDVKPNTPDIVVDKLNNFFQSDQFTQDDKNVVDSGGTVEIQLVVEKKDESGDNVAENVDSIKAIAGSTKEIGIFLDLTVNKIIKPEVNRVEKPIRINELNDVITLNIPLPAQMQGKNNYVVYRYHGTAVQTINQIPNGDGEYIELSANKRAIILHTKKFSTYAIAYDRVTTPDNGGSENNNSGSSSGNNNGGGSSSNLPTITTEPTSGGKITISKDKKEANITPDEGYVIADVMVDGKSIGATTKVTFTNTNNHKIEAVFVKKSGLPYYMQNGTKVYIGFSAIANDLYNYIAPTGEIVEFRDNPKYFIDNTIEWAKSSIDFVTERELFVGTRAQMFSPNEAMTRAMFVTVIGRLYERSYGNISGENTFSDVDKNAYYAKYVGWAHENNIIKGVGENKFAPKDIVTREQMAAIIQNFATFLNKADIEDRALAYADSLKISSWAVEGAKYCQETKVITGRDGGNFVPKGNATRAEVAAVIERFIKTIVK